MTTIEENNQSKSDFVYDTSKLLKLLESIALVSESCSLQSIINIHLKELLGAEYVLMVPLLPSSEEGLIQVVNDQILEKEFRFSVSFHPPGLQRLANYSSKHRESTRSNEKPTKPPTDKKYKVRVAEKKSC